MIHVHEAALTHFIPLFNPQYSHMHSAEFIYELLNSNTHCLQLQNFTQMKLETFPKLVDWLPTNTDLEPQREEAMLIE